jgi:hypothetical protein
VQDPRLREAIEHHAMLAARKHYEELGYLVEDTHLTRSYDYVATRGAVLRSKGRKVRGRQLR